MSNTKIALGYVGTDDTLRPETEDLYRLVFIEGEGPKLLAKDAENDIDMSAVLVTGDITGTNVTVTGGENKALGDVTLSLPQSVAPEASPTFAGLTVTGNVTGITKAMVGLENVNNTSDADKPVSRAQREEIDLKGSATDMEILKWGGLKVSGKNKTVAAFGGIGLVKWDYNGTISGGQVSRITTTRYSTENVSYMQIDTNSSFSNSSPQTDFNNHSIFPTPANPNNDFPFTANDEVFFRLETSIGGNCLFEYAYLDASHNVISGLGFLYMQLTNGQTKVLTTTNTSVAYIRLTSFKVSYSRISGSNVPSPFSGVSSTKFYFGVYDKGYSSEITLKTKLENIDSSVSVNSTKVENLDKGYGSSCKLQKSKGTYLFPTSASVSGGSYISLAKDTNNLKFSNPSYRVGVFGAAVVDATGSSGRGTLTLNFDSFTPAKSISIWMKVPSRYSMDNPRAGVTSETSLSQLSFRFYNDASLVVDIKRVYYTDMNAGWWLYKFLSDDFNGSTFNKITIGVDTEKRKPDTLFWINSIVIDQEATPTLCLSLDSELDDRTEASGFGTYLENNKIPFSARVYLDATGASSVGRQRMLKLYKLGLCDINPYSGAARTLTGFDAAVDYLKNDSSNGRNVFLNRGMAERDVIICANAENYLDDMLMLGEKAAGYKILRCTSSYYRTNYIDLDSCAVPCAQFGAFSSLGIIDSTWITTQINSGKARIDALIKYGSFSCIMSHQVVTQAQANSSDIGLASVYEVMVGILDYALEKQAAGQLQIMTLQNLYEKCVN